MATIALLAAALATAITVLTVVIARRTARRTGTVEGLAIERTRTTDARAVGGIFGVHGAGAEATAALTAPEATRTFH
ncbi:MAG TPA: hypothetical protein VLH10_07965 [Yinghuangia sp.]|uniref:hypothetical protein n=1 Tax=Yinghuangia sp. YIM S10712 TaxID=3436930 RepID=UPI002C475437|nr:hypothetical protein [Yinghuangia sp.]